MKIIDIRMRPPFKPYLGKNNMFDTEATNPFAISKFYKNFGMNMSKSMKTASIEDLFKDKNYTVVTLYFLLVNNNEYM